MNRLLVCIILAGASTAVLAAPPAQPAAPTAPAAQKQAQKEAPPAAPFDFTFATPDKLSFADFPKVELRAATSATFIGFQFGTGKLDVAYICFDTVDPHEIHDRAYFHVAGSTNPPAAERGRNVQERQARNVKFAREKPQRFEFPVLRSRMGENELMFKIACTYGHGNKANLHMTAEAVIRGAKGSANCALHANLSNFAVPSPNEIKVIQLIGPPALNLYENTRVNPPSVRPYVSIGDSVLMEPLRGMDRNFELQVRPKGGDKFVEKAKVEIKIPEYSGLGEAGAGETHQLKTNKPGEYEVLAAIDLGPFGPLSAKTSVPVAPKLKAK